MNPTNQKRWHFFDAEGQILGRLSTQIAVLLRGKDKVTFTPNIDDGDSVVVINAEKIVLTGHKEDQKRYYKHTGYLGNMKTRTVKELRKTLPAFIIEEAVRGMLPDNKLAKDMEKRLHVYAGSEHPHQNIKFVNQE